MGWLCRKPLRIFLLLSLFLSIKVVWGTAEPGKLVRITLLQLNDVYQNMPVDDGKRGGLARVATLVKRVRAENPNTLFLLAGDTISPSVASNIFRGQQIIAAWNILGLDYATFGNHEFDFGDETLRARMRESKFTWIVSNVMDKATGRIFGEGSPYILREVGGIKLGIVGVVTPETRDSSKPGPNVEFQDPYQTAARLVPELRKQGAQVIVALTHLFMEEDKQLARTAEIDAILGGHEHSVMASLSGKTPIFKWGSDARDLGRIDLFVQADTGKLESLDWKAIPVDERVPEDNTAAKILGEYEKKLAAELDVPIGRTAVPLDARQHSCRRGETNLGNFIADCLRTQAQAEVALINGGAFRSNRIYEPGPLTRRDVMSILPFENHLVKLEISGESLRQALEHGVSRISNPSGHGSFPHVSGMEIVYDLQKPPGSRLVSVTIQGISLDPHKTYTLATNSYLVEGGDGYKSLQEAKLLISPLEGPVVPAIVMQAIKAVPEIAPKLEGRIREAK